MAVRSVKELIVYRKAFEFAMAIFRVSQGWPKEERYGLTDQIRRSSPSVAMNLREAWAKRRYEAYFISQLTDCDGENGETHTSLDFAFACGYLTEDEHHELTAACAEVGRMLGAMLLNPTPFLLTPRDT